MNVSSPIAALDRHALVMTIWLPAGLVAASLLHLGLGQGRAGFILAGFLAIVAGFVGHVLVNFVYASGFSPRERGLGLALYLLALVAFGFALLLKPGFAAQAFAPMAGGFLVLFAVVVFTMLTGLGVRGAFESFDVIRSFRTVTPPAMRGRDDAP